MAHAHGERRPPYCKMASVLAGIWHVGVRCDDALAAGARVGSLHPIWQAYAAEFDPEANVECRAAALIPEVRRVRPIAITGHRAIPEGVRDHDGLCASPLVPRGDPDVEQRGERSDH